MSGRDGAADARDHPSVDRGLEESRPWPTVGLPPARWTDTRLQAHHAVQLLASFAGEFLEPREDDGHRSLCWVPEHSVLATGSADRGDAPLTLTFDPATFVLRARIGALAPALDTASDAAPLSGGQAHRLDGRLELRGRSLADARAWLVGWIADVSGVAPVLAAPEYEIPTHVVAGGAPFAPDPVAAGQLANWFAAAAAVLVPKSDGSRAGPLRCWPHHFDIATLVTVHPPADGASARTVGIGMSPGDVSIPLPYGYVTPYPYPWERPRPRLDFGHWHTEGWLGAVLPAAEWLGDDGRTRVERFFEQAARVAEELLTPP